MKVIRLFRVPEPGFKVENEYGVKSFGDLDEEVSSSWKWIKSLLAIVKILLEIRHRSSYCIVATLDEPNEVPLRLSIVASILLPLGSLQSVLLGESLQRCVTTCLIFLYV